MNLSELGEFGLIRRFAPLFAPNAGSGVLGIGDDCAVIPQKKADSLLVTTDLLVEDVHFLRHKITPFNLGEKALAVNLSDIAAMGGIPTAAFLSIALPHNISVEWIDDFFAGVQSLSQSTATPLLGGDTTRSPQRVIIDMAVLGKASPQYIKYRSTAKAGDKICVTGFLGDSGGGLRLLLENLDEAADSDGQALLRAHCSPLPHLSEGQWLARHVAVHAMMDVSDGIDSDLRRIMEASHVGARVFLDKLPLSNALMRTTAVHHWNAVELAAAAGEDYCLLCTVAEHDYPSLTADFAAAFGRPLPGIGEITDTGTLIYEQNGVRADFAGHGWDHFNENPASN
jgi:thiamine-monophosphate kinase